MTDVLASITLGRDALTSASLGTVAACGGLVHFVLSGIFGAVFAVLYARGGREVTPAEEAAFGVGCGLLLWLVNFQIIARVLFPWFLGAAPGSSCSCIVFFMVCPSQSCAESRRVRARRRPAPRDPMSRRFPEQFAAF